MLIVLERSKIVFPKRVILLRSSPYSYHEKIRITLLNSSVPCRHSFRNCVTEASCNGCGFPMIKIWLITKYTPIYSMFFSVRRTKNWRIMNAALDSKIATEIWLHLYINSVKIKLRRLSGWRLKMNNWKSCLSHSKSSKLYTKQ